MSPTDILADLGLIPLKAVVFQSMLLLVAITLEAMVLRQHLRLSYQTSVQYAATINLLTTSLGWIAFLSLEAVLPTPLRQQIMSYVLFSRFFDNPWLDILHEMMVGVAIVVFFATYWVKLHGLSALVALLGKAPVLEAPALSDRLGRSRSSRRGAPSAARSRTATYSLAVLQANALSFTAIVVLLFFQIQMVLS
jgi:hypothetical protein